MSRSDNNFTGFKGVPINRGTGEPVKIPEEEYYYVCSECGQSVDMRDLGEVFHHKDIGHKPLPTN